MVQHLLEEVMLQRVQHVEEVLSRWTSAIWKLLREVLLKVIIFRKLWPKSLDAHFVIVRYFDK